MSPQDFSSWLRSPVRAVLLMGVLNATPDSFTELGRITDPDQAAEHAEQLAASGADWIDIGGESTRPGALPVDADEQIRRVIPVIQAIRRRLDILISIDTTKARVAQAALNFGANVVNDISAGRDDPEMFSLIAKSGAAIILMHMQGTPATMQRHPEYEHVTAEVSAFLTHRRDEAVAAGVQPGRILLDPGLGFGKSLSHNLRLLRDIPRLAALGHPIVIGPSRKSFLGKLLNEPRPEDRLFGTAAVVAWCATQGAGAVRVHDAKPMSQVLGTLRAITSTNIEDFLKD